MIKTYFCVIICLLASIKGLSADFETCISIPTNSSLKVVRTLNGQINGECKIIPVSYSNGSKINSEVFSWLSIPYAEPPLNQNRFKKPVPVKNWNGIIETKRLPSACIQLPIYQLTNYSEDCLYLNVYSRSDVYMNKNKTLNPVLVWIHGGGFVIGGTEESSHEPSTIVAMSGAVVVAIQYRLDVFGFLSLDQTNATGNQGILDQSLALKWIYENIQSFGGDPSKITIQGESAGASSVFYHLIYPESWPYFRKAILQSVYAMTRIVLKKEDASRRAKDLFLSLNCNSSFSNADLLLCAQKSNANLILNQAHVYMPSLPYLQNSSIILGYGMNIFGHPNIDNIVFNQSIDSTLRAGKVKKCKIITGFNSDEFTLFLGLSGWPLTSQNNYGYNGFDFTNFLNIFNSVLFYYPSYPTIKEAALTQEIVNSYFKINEMPLNRIKPIYLNYLIQIMSDAWFVCPNFELAEIYSSIQLDTYVYEFKYRGANAYLPSYLSTATHSDELYFTFGEPLSNKNSSVPNNYPNQDKVIAEKMLKYWFNFVFYDDPNYNKESSQADFWQPFNKKLSNLNAYDKMKNGNFLLMQNSSFEMKSDFSSHNCKTWGFTTNSLGTNDMTPSFLMKIYSSIKFRLAHLF